jgi:phosphoribosylformylglycinamidine cyclo-ligase
MPGMYAKGDYDLAGFAVGAVERDRLITGRTVAAGDVVLGLASAGVHSNGFSLVRQIVAASGLPLSAPAPFATDTAFGAALLTPTRLYVKPVLQVLKTVPIKALAHITGGGLIENIPRVLPDGLGVEIDGTRWTAPPVFGWLSRQGVADSEMARVFNCGIGMVVVVAPAQARAALDGFAAAGQPAQEIGRIVAAAGAERVHVTDLAHAWRS